jgi:hypothetical protein
MEVSAIIFKSGAYGKKSDLGSSNSQRIAAGPNLDLTLDERLRMVHVVERRAGDVVNDYLAPVEALSIIELKREPLKAAAMPERNGQQQQARR